MKEAKHFCVLVGSTPDISHVNQLSVLVQYVNKPGPKERFLAFINFQTQRLFRTKLGENVLKNMTCLPESSNLNPTDPYRKARDGYVECLER